ncbi:MAG: hypothetical protein M5U26_16685 [Planctomycetota bacterium]|nr:hypothetical protein [Planctomycetota bacterium]
MRGLQLALLAALVSCLAHADTVKLKNGLEFSNCKIYRETPEFIVILVYNEAGKVQIPREMIEKIDYDLASRLEALQEDDWKAQYELGVWAFEKGMYPDAIAQFEKVKGKEGAGADLFKLLGKAYDRRTQSDKAYESFKEHLRMNPGDEETRKRADELAKELGLDQNPAPNPADPNPNPQAPKEPLKPDLGLEATYKWKPEKWDNSNACNVTVQTDNDTGNKLLAVQSVEGNKDKFAFSGSGKNPLDLSASKELIFKAYHNNNRPLRVAMAFINKKGEFFETKQERVAPNTWVNLTFPIDGAVFKSSRNNFNGYTDTLDGKDNVARILFLVYEQSAFTLYVDYIFFREGKK